MPVHREGISSMGTTGGGGRGGSVFDGEHFTKDVSSLFRHLYYTTRKTRLPSTAGIKGGGGGSLWVVKSNSRQNLLLVLNDCQACFPLFLCPRDQWNDFTRKSSENLKNCLI